MLRCTDYSETSQVAAILTADLGQVHVLAKGSRRPRKDGRVPLDVISHCDVVLALRKPGQLHLLAEWTVSESFSMLRKDLGRFWPAFYAAEVALACTSENPDDGPICDDLVRFLRALEKGGEPRLRLFRFLLRVLKTIGHVPVTESCVQCGGGLQEAVRFSAEAGGALCGDCGLAAPSAFALSRGALAVLNRLAAHPAGPVGLRVTSSQVAEIQRAFDEQIQYHLGKPLRTARFLRAEFCRGLSTVK